VKAGCLPGTGGDVHFQNAPRPSEPWQKMTPGRPIGSHGGMWDVGRRGAIPCATALLFSIEQDQGTSPSSPGVASQAASTSLPLPVALHRERERCQGRRPHLPSHQANHISRAPPILTTWNYQGRQRVPSHEPRAEMSLNQHEGVVGPGSFAVAVAPNCPAFVWGSNIIIFAPSHLCPSHPRGRHPPPTRARSHRACPSTGAETFRPFPRGKMGYSLDLLTIHASAPLSLSLPPHKNPLAQPPSIVTHHRTNLGSTSPWPPSPSTSSPPHPPRRFTASSRGWNRGSRPPPLLGSIGGRFAAVMPRASTSDSVGRPSPLTPPSTCAVAASLTGRPAGRTNAPNSHPDRSLFYHCGQAAPGGPCRGDIIPAGIPGDGRGTNSPWHGYGALYKDGKVGIHPSAPMSPTLHILMGFGFKPEGPS